MQSQKDNKISDLYTWPINHQDEPMEVETEYPQQDIVDLFTQLDNDFILTPYKEAHLIRLQSQIQTLIKTRLQIQENIRELVQKTIHLVNEAQLRHTEHPHLERWYRSGLIGTIIQDAYLANPITPFCISCNGTLVANGAEEGIFYNSRTWISRQEAAYEIEKQQQQQQEIDQWIKTEQESQQ
ncbi:hypothetical protein INT45_012595 [Circinella minor]|uniref:Uncharacterized protein n=1 Tax=Circinella minor TaxID=1195481 RepID=A0A8H7RAU6_9FUNG|nr:hypothetical protein INT45_012595 [Circinella minor]